MISTISFISFNFLNLFEKSWADSVIGTINNLNLPKGVAFNPTNHDIYIGSFSGNILAIDSLSKTIVTSISIGNEPTGIIYNPFNHNMYISNQGTHFVSVIDTTNNRIVHNIPVGNSPFGITYNPVNHYIYVANFGSDTISVINTNNSVASEITLPNRNTPSSITYNPDKNNIYVTSETTSTVIIIDAKNNMIINTIALPTGSLPSSITYNPDNQKMYVSNSGSGTVSVIDTTENKVVDTIYVENYPNGIAFNPSDHNIYVTNLESNSISIISPSPRMNSIQSNAPPVANSGHDQQVQISQLVELNGLQSFDPNGFSPLTYNWTQTHGPGVKLHQNTSANPNFIAPLITKDTKLTFDLIVTNTKRIHSHPSSVSITVIPLPPVNKVENSITDIIKELLNNRSENNRSDEINMHKAYNH